jgi:predicted cupin superfamily sugar epimerase
MTLDPRARDLIDGLRLQPHPEGGHYREIHRSTHRVTPPDGRALRAASTGIYFLLAAGEVSRWHRVQSDETWHHYEGAPLELLIATPDGREVRRAVLGRALECDGPACTVPADHWQAARPTGAYALVGCTVAPGFEFADFAFLRDEPDAARVLLRAAPEFEPLL